MRQTVDKLLKSIGLVIRRNNIYSRADWRLKRFLLHHNVDMVLDIGASRGHYSMALIDVGYKGSIISFEALPHIHAELSRNATSHREQWTVAPCCALSHSNEAIQFYVTTQYASSSMLQPARALYDNAHISVSKTIQVPSRRLDHLARELNIHSSRIFMKIDVQGAEQSVIEGAAELMPNVKGLALEMSLVRLYDGQPLAHELNALMEAKGFSLWDCEPVLRDAHTGQMLQYDGVYFRN